MGKLAALELVFQVEEIWYFCSQMPFVSLRMKLLQDTFSHEYFKKFELVMGKETGSEVLKAWLEVLLLLASSTVVRQGNESKPMF